MRQVYLSAGNKQDMHVATKQGKQVGLASNTVVFLQAPVEEALRREKYIVDVPVADGVADGAKGSQPTMRYRVPPRSADLAEPLTVVFTWGGCACGEECADTWG